MILLKYDATEADFVNTSDAYASKLFLTGNTIIVPYINIGLMPGNPINSKQSVIDFSYYVLKGVFNTNNEEINNKLPGSYEFMNPGTLLSEYIVCGGFESTSMELAVYCKERTLYLYEDAKVSTSLLPFVPKPTPNFKQNLPDAEVVSFFAIEGLPDLFKSMMADNYCSFCF